MHRASVLAGTISLLCVIATGCGDEADPTPAEPDPSGTPFVYQPPTTAEHVMYNVMTAYERRDMVVYTASLHPDFRFAGVEPGTGSTVDLAYDDEIETTTRMMEQVATVAIEWAEFTFSEESDVVGYPAKDGYRSVRLEDVTIHLSPADTEEPDTVIVCDAVFVFVELIDDPGPARHHQWRLVYHEETAASDDTSAWTDVKLRYLADPR